MTNKKLITILCTAALSLGLLVGCSSQPQQVEVDPSTTTTETTNDTSTQGANNGAITSEEAQTIALNHAGVDASAANFVRTDYEWDDNSYEVEFYADNVEYDYEIDAATGDIIAYDSEIEGFNIGDELSGETASAGVITEEDAKAIALKHAGLNESDVKGLRVTRDRDDGRQEYEVEFRKDMTEYDYEINAATGDIISYDIDND